ncbi:MAG: ATP-binding cassette domain-containing protein [Chloroflexi bacterium]|nr:MAG: ATP-binding cassette domain-containing protein [Chloroflexota bacterium]MBL1197124.1 ATP-binding cassette domain-containing protein [Chloroflexota bacterium]
MTEAILQAQGLHKKFDEVYAVKGVSFDIKAGEIFSLLGPNGAGKTTTISMLSCLLTPTEGDAKVDGFSVTGEANQVKQAIGVVPQEIALYPTISAKENLQFWGRMYGLRGKHLQERVDATLDIAGLADRADGKVETFSGGMKRRINIAVGLLHNPKILFMDEPTVGIDPQSRRRILDTVQELNKLGLAVLNTTHYMEEAQELSDRIGIIDNGELIATGTLDELIKMVGEYDTVRLCLDVDGQKIEDVIEPLKSLPEVKQVSPGEDCVMIQVPDSENILGDMVGRVTQAGAHIRSLEIQEPNLEAVFLHLTGRALRD